MVVETLDFSDAKIDCAIFTKVGFCFISLLPLVFSKGTSPMFNLAANQFSAGSSKRFNL